MINGWIIFINIAANAVIARFVVLRRTIYNIVKDAKPSKSPETKTSDIIGVSQQSTININVTGRSDPSVPDMARTHNIEMTRTGTGGSGDGRRVDRKSNSKSESKSIEHDPEDDYEHFSVATQGKVNDLAIVANCDSEQENESIKETQNMAISTGSMENGLFEQAEVCSPKLQLTIFGCLFVIKVCIFIYILV